MLILGAIAVFVIERNFLKAGAFALAGSILTFFGFMHSERIGLAQSPEVATAYVLVALFLAACARFSTLTPLEPAPAEH